MSPAAKEARRVKLPGGEDYPGRSKGTSRTESGLAISQDTSESKPSCRRSRNPLQTTTPNSSSGSPIPPELVCPPGERPKEPLFNGTLGEAGGCGSSFEGTSGPAEEGSGEEEAESVRAAKP